MSKVRDFDHGYKGLFNRVYGLDKPVITVGVFANDGEELYDDAVSVMQVAVWNEFGTDTIPERSFIRAWFDENQAKARRGMAKLLEAVIAGKYTKEQALELLAQRFVGEIQRRIAQGIAPANAPETVRRKGSSKPLIDTGQLRSSISYAIDGKQSESRAGALRRKTATKKKKLQARENKRARAKLVKRGFKVLKSAKRGLLKSAKKIFRVKRKRTTRTKT